jgi:hypothetical protein
MEIHESGTKRWRNSKGEYHRTDGPAIEWVDGDKEWYANGERHRLNGPAIEFENGNKEWWLNGILHRINGPAVEWADGEKVWWVNDKLLGWNDKGFWALWDLLTPEQKKDPVLLSYLPEKF